MASDGTANAVATAGSILDDRYRLVDRIAGGGMGDVWRAVDEVLGRTVAIKVLRPEYADDKDLRERLRREARAAGAISDSRVVPVFDFGEVERENAPPLSYLVMEYVDGESLSSKLSALGPLGAERTILILEQTASALQAAHDAGVIHRDIKPGNIMVTPQGDLKITDFGIAHASDSLSLTRTGTTTGTAKYLSPEQANGQSATAASDLYSLGVVAYACLTGEVPFHQGNEIAIALAHVQQEPPALPTDVPAGLRDLIMRMLEKDPSDRPANAGEVAAAARSLRYPDVPDPEVQHPFPVTTQASDTPPRDLEHPHGLHDPDGTATYVPEIASGAALESIPMSTRADAPVGARTEEAGVSRRRRNVRRGAIAIIVLLIGAAAFMLWPSGGVQVPDVVGMPRAEAQAIMTKAGLRTKFVTADVPRNKSGIVVEQSQGATSKVDKGSTITLTIASGQVELPTDALLGSTYDEAASMLKSLGLKARKRTAFSTSKSGTVIGVDPKRRASVGSVVTLTVAVGSVPTNPKPTSSGPSPGAGAGSGKPSPTASPSLRPTATPSPSPAASVTPSPTATGPTPTSRGTVVG